MSNQKRLSQLSFAVFALLTAALPCVAQTEASKAQNQAAKLDANRANEIAVLGNDRLSVRKAASKTADVRVTEKQRARFEQSIEQAATASPAFMTNPTFSGSDWEKTRRLSNDNESTFPKRITFVPSRGQKLPQS
jgi:hypothetical protein